MPDFLKFAASLHRINQDHHGEWTVSFKVPLSESQAILSLSKHIEEELTVVIGGSGNPTLKGRFIAADDPS